jgi:predicted MPP superfamily phosphohydrolase
MIKLNSSQNIYDNHWALLVGVDDYSDVTISSLKVCADDVQAVYDVITARGYAPDGVKLLQSPSGSDFPATRAAIFSALTSLAETADQNDLLLFYFSGHGIVRDGLAYLLPSDASYTSVADTAINFDRVKQVIQTSAARAKVIILDACHAGAQIGKAFTGMTKDFVRRVFEEAEGLAILASCKERQVSWEWPEKGRSVFTHYLLDGLSGAADFDKKGFVTVNDISRYVTDKVKRWAVQRSLVQTPTLQYTVAGDIVLLPYSLSEDMLDGKDLGADVTVGVTEPKVKEALLVSEHKVPFVYEERTDSTITWLHLSDFHFRTSTTYNSNIVLEALLRDVAERIQKEHLQPDFIVISGDLAFSGQPKEYRLAQQFLDHLLKVASLPKERLFLVPGNHDVDRSTISPLTASVTRLLNDREAVRKLMNNDDDCQLTFKRFQGYQDFTTAYLGECTLFDNKRCFYVKQIQIGDLDVAILGLNSAWLSVSDGDRDYLIVGERPVRTALRMAEKADLRLAVMHHPFDWLRDFDRNDVKPLLCDSCDYILHGHMHQTDLMQSSTPDSRAMIVAAGACYETRKHPNSYNFVQLNPKIGEGAIHLRMYSDQNGGFWTKDVESYHNVRDGLYVFELPDRLRQQRKNVISSSPGIPKNSFIYGRATHSEEFVNREDVLSAVFNRLYNGESTAIVGEPHIGKTSLLQKLTDEDVQCTYLEDSASSLLISYLDLLPIGPDYNSRAFWEEAMAPLWEHPDHWVTPRHSRNIIRAGYTRRSLERIFTHLGRNGQRLVLLLDKFERQIHPNFQLPSFFALLRSLASRTGGLVLVTASRESVAEMTERMKHLLGVGSPFFNIMIDMRLRPFDDPTVHKLLDRAGDAFSFNERHFIRRVAGRHPFLLQAMAATFLETQGVNRHSRTAKRFYERVVSHFDDVWHCMDDRTRAASVILALVELGGEDLRRVFAHKDIKYADRFGFALRNMAEQGLAEQVGEDWPFDLEHLVPWQGKRWTVGAQALAWWLRDVVIAETRQIPAYDTWLADQRYRVLMTQEQWEHLLSAVRDTYDWSARDIGVMADAIFKTLVRREE